MFSSWYAFLYDHIWSHLEYFSEIYHKMAIVIIMIAVETWPPEKLVMKNMSSKYKLVWLINEIFSELNILNAKLSTSY